jgi:glycosyltransferase involved in cell wall biosynthesis
MKVLLVSNYVHDQQESMLRFAGLLHEALDERGVHVEFVAPPQLFGRLRKGTVGLGKWLGYVDKFVIFPRRLRRKVTRDQQSGRLVVHICDHSNSPWTAALSGVPHLVTVHDLLAVRSALGEFPENPTGWSGRILQRMIVQGLKRSQFVVCDSDATRADFIRLTRRKVKDSGKVLLGLNYPYSPVTGEEAQSTLQPLFARLSVSVPAFYLLHVGGNSWYKNREGVLRMFAAVEEAETRWGIVLVMAGTLPSDHLRKLSEDLGIHTQVHWLGKVTNQELEALYSSAQALLFPSLAEGFGWPLLEAQACGCPVITSNRASLPEVAGDGALYIDPRQVLEGARVVEQLLQMGPAQRQSLRERGFRNIQRFTVTQMVDGYVEVYERLAHANPVTDRASSSSQDRA